MPVTAYDIARDCRVTQPTVSKVLTNKAAAIRPEIRRRIIESARRLGYRPHAAARIMVKGRFSKGGFATVALIIGEGRGTSTLTGDHITGITTALRRRELNLLVARLRDDDLVDPRRWPNVLRERCCDGLLMNYTYRIPEGIECVLAELRLPTVWINVKRPADCVYFDDFGGARRVTERFLAQGRRHVSYLDWARTIERLPQGHYSETDRYEGYCSAMREAGLSPDAVLPGLTRGRERGDFLRRWLSLPDRPDAVVCYCGAEALALAAAQVGLSVPDDLAVAVFSDTTFVTVDVPVTIVRTSEHDLGAQAVEMLLKKLSEPEQPIAPLAFTMEVIEPTASPREF